MPTNNKNEQKYIISEFYDFTADRNLILEAEQNNKPVVVKGILQKADTKNRNGRVYPTEILRREIAKYSELVKEKRALGECVPPGTQIFTENGWKNIEDVCINENVYTLNINTNNLEIQPVVNTISKEYNDDMIRIYNDSNLDMLVTKKHKVILWNRKNKPYILTAEELFDKIQKNDSGVSHSHIKHSGKWIGNYEKFFTIPGSDIKIKTEDWAAFLGIYIAEGHCTGTKGSVSNRKQVGITQVKEESKKQIKNLLDILPFEYSIHNTQFIIHNKHLHKHLFRLGNSFEKFIPEYAKNWNKKLLNILLNWMLLGDGRNRHSRNNELIKEYSTISKQLSEDVFEIMLKLGNGATINTFLPKDRYIIDEKIIESDVDNGDGTLSLVSEVIKTKRLIKSENSHVLYTTHLRTSNGIYLDTRFIKAEKVPYNGQVYCVSVENKTWLMKYNNKVSWTHNCDHPNEPIVSLANVSHMIIEMWWEGSVLYGKVEILDTPKGRILKDLLKAGVKLGISSRGVGSVKSNKNGEDVVQEDFELIAFDFVSSPSTPGAYMFQEGKKWGLTKLLSDVLPKKQGTLETAFDRVNEELLSKENKLIDLLKNNFWSEMGK